MSSTAQRALGGAMMLAMALAAIAAALVLNGIVFSFPSKADGFRGNWTGCYIGAAGGYSTATTDASVSFGPASAGVDSLGYAGGSYSGLAGCDLHVAPKIVLGAWFDYTKADADFDVTLTGAPGSLLHTGLDTSWAVGGRAGYLVTERSMIYVLAGYTRADTENISAPAFGPAAVLAVPTLEGYVIGGGAEFALGSGFFLQTQYSYANYDSVSLPLGPGVGAPALALDTDVQQVRVGLTYKLGLDDAPPAVKKVVNDVAVPIGSTPLK